MEIFEFYVKECERLTKELSEKKQKIKDLQAELESLRSQSVSPDYWDQGYSYAMEYVIQSMERI